MNRNKFSGWKDVFSFTLRKTTESKAFMITTICFAISLLLITCVGNIIAASSSNKDKVSPITVVHVLDESGYVATDFSMLSGMGTTAYSGITFITTEAGKTADELLKGLEAADKTEVLLHITKEKDEFAMRIGIPAYSSVQTKDGEALLNQLVPFFEMNKLTQIGLTEVQLASINTQITTTLTSAGEEEESIGEMVIKMVTPMLFSLILYIMLLLYGQSICKSLITEKTSKLMELLLTSITPYALIVGKILAMVFLAIFQFILWIGSGIIGFILGDFIAKSMYPDYQNSIIAILNQIKENTSAAAFSVPAILLAILAICLGFLFYCVLAGMVGAVLNKAEDLSSGMAVYQIPVIVSFLFTYILPVQQGKTSLGFVRYFPFTAPFSIPADILVGNIGILQGCIAIAILALSTLLLIMLTGKLYKGMVLFNGNKVSAKNLIQMFKAK